MFISKSLFDMHMRCYICCLNKYLKEIAVAFSYTLDYLDQGNSRSNWLFSRNSTPIVSLCSVHYDGTVIRNQFFDVSYDQRLWIVSIPGHTDSFWFFG